MKIGIVTYHKSPSYGACLQAYATQELLKKYTDDVVIIDYLNGYEQRIKKIFFSSDGTIISGIKNAAKSILFGRKRLLKRAYKRFQSNYNLTRVTYHNRNEMESLTFDILIVGSDQVWNPKVSGELDPVFLLAFGQTQKRISFASSFGSYCLNANERTMMKNALKQFDAVSVREQFAADQIRGLGINNVKIINDPTMLVPIKVWESMLEEVPYKNYILTYFVSGSFCEFAEEVGEIKGSKDRIFNIQSSNFHWNGVDKTLVGVTPEAFLGFIKSADLVITDSFHGTVFSILFHKKFIYIENKNNPVRIRELLNKLNLTHHVYPYYKDYHDIGEYEFEAADKQIKSMRDDAISWIENTLDIIGGELCDKR